MRHLGNNHMSRAIASAASPLRMGATGCMLHLQPLQVDLVVPLLGVTYRTLSIPNAPPLIGLHVRTQAIGLEQNGAGHLRGMPAAPTILATMRRSAN